MQLAKGYQFSWKSVMSFRGNYHWTLEILYVCAGITASNWYKILNNPIYSQLQDAYTNAERNP